jgi:hypothetical protein
MGCGVTKENAGTLMRIIPLSGHRILRNVDDYRCNLSLFRHLPR